MRVGLAAWLRWYNFRSTLGERLRECRGQTVFEYFLLIGGVVVLAAAAVFSFGGAVKSSLCNSITALNGSTGC